MLNGGEIIVTTLIGCSMVLGIVAILAWMIVTLSSSKRRSGSMNDEETRILQEVFHGLNKMEERVEALETLLLEREKRG